nr:MAG TPA: hypothetical protein [Caudoviricetes sp.]
MVIFKLSCLFGRYSSSTLPIKLKRRFSVFVTDLRVFSFTQQRKIIK